eukprot:211342-Prorocentrum_minimum.AAC.2
MVPSRLRAAARQHHCEDTAVGTTTEREREARFLLQCLFALRRHGRGGAWIIPIQWVYGREDRLSVDVGVPIAICTWDLNKRRVKTKYSMSNACAFTGAH